MSEHISGAEHHNLCRIIRKPRTQGAEHRNIVYQNNAE